MKNIFWLIRREFWEHKAELLWAPLMISMFFLLLMAWWAFGQNYLGFVGSITINNSQITAGDIIDPNKWEALTATIKAGVLLAAGIQLSITSLIGFSYSANCLSDERRDRSVLFWKSLPTSDLQTIGAKAITASLLIPAISMGILAVAIPIDIFILLWGGSGLHGSFVTDGHLFKLLSLFVMTVLAYLPLQVLWSLPTVGWCMLVSGVARANSSLKAFGLPLIGFIVMAIVQAMFGIGDSNSTHSPLFDVYEAGRISLIRLITGTLPLSWSFLAKTKSPDTSVFLDYGWTSVNAYQIVFGVIAGALMIYGAMLMRKRFSGD